ncbi:hypothetical protein JWG40_19650 [Leptospira sp. 201903074]|uniref:polymorphic toxin-type HINT domain-containing protein n=1 Tax=Leptospira abararensis TaxID=2810036 RepID=UPI0019657598|nr:polymorphic toxin-type HINT domain-containing protein [Leptospira abararensis]MBM9549247.1 hypothetical protein [Leptospira abararensis]
MARIEEALKKKADWEVSLLNQARKGDQFEIDQVYAEIQKTIANMGSAPNAVLLQNNANKILNTIMNSKPQVLDNRMLEQGMYTDVQFFVDELQKSKYDESNIEKMKSLTKEMEDRSKQMAVLQTLDSLWSLPLTFEATIAEQNKALDEQLSMQLLQDNFIKMGPGYVRSAVDKMGNPSYQVLPIFSPYLYIKPDKLPTVKDSNGKEWDLTDYQALQGKGGPASAELTMMVRLARNQMQTDFKLTYDPEKSENREVGYTMLDPKAMAKVARAAQSALGQLASDPQKMFEFNSADAKGREAMIESAKNSGYLVGPTVGGAFGTHHFNQYYPILKMKEKYNEIKAEGEALNGNGFANAVGGVVSVATGGLINAKQAAKFMNDNGDVIDTIVSVAAVIAAPFTGGASLLALAAYKAVQGAYSGGVVGALTGGLSGVANGFTQMVGVTVDATYSYDEGFGASVGVGVGGVATVGISYSDQGGFGASVSAGIGPLQVGLSYSQQGGFGANIGFKSNNLQLGLSYSEKDGFGGQVGAAGAGMRGGLNYTQADGIGVYAGKMLGEGALANTTSAEIGWNRDKGFQASYGSDDARATFSQKDGFGVKLSGEFEGIGGSLEFTQRGGFTASLSGELMKGVNGSLSYNSKTGFEASVSGQIGGKNLNLGIGEGGRLSFNHSNVGAEESLFINSMDELQSKNDSDIQKAKAEIVAKSFDEYKKKMIELNPDLAEYANDPKKLQDKIKELDEGGKLNRPGDKDKAAVDSGDSQDSILSKVGGAIADLGYSFLGTRVSSGMGYVDEKGVFHQRTCFTAGTKIHTKEGLKNIEDIQIGDMVLSKSDETGELSYRKVVETFIRQTEAIYTVSFTDGTTLETTWNHPFRVKKQGHALEKFSIENTDWVQAKDLHPGDVALRADGQELVVTDITIDERAETVYNFEVEEYHTYFVGESGVWVHNADRSMKGYSNPRGEKIINKKEHNRAQQKLDQNVDKSKEAIKDFAKNAKNEDGTPPDNSVDAMKESLQDNLKPSGEKNKTENLDPNRQKYRGMSETELDNQLKVEKGNQWAELQWSYGTDDMVSPVIEQRTRQSTLDRYTDTIDKMRRKGQGEAKVDDYISNLKKNGEIPEKNRPQDNRWVQNYNLTDTEERIIRIQSEIKRKQEPYQGWNKKEALPYYIQ